MRSGRMMIKDKGKVDRGREGVIVKDEEREDVLLRRMVMQGCDRGGVVLASPR